MISPLPIRRLASESVASIWARRCLTIPLILASFSLAWLLLPLWLGGLMAWDKGTGQSHLPKARASLFLFYYLFCEVWGLALAGMLWVATLGGATVGRQRYVKANFRLQGLWTRALFFGTQRLFRVKVESEGLELAAPSPFVLMVRHSSLADTVLASTFIGHPSDTGLRYILKRELLWDPCLDVVGRRLPNHFVDRTGKRSEAEVAAVRALSKDLMEGEGLLIYPEGTRFSEAKLRRGLQRLEESKKDHLTSIARKLRHVLPPRTAGSLAILEEAAGTDVLVLAHTGLEGAARWSDFWSGKLLDQTLHLRLRRIHADAIPATDRERWLFELWAEMDEWIEARRGEKA